MKIINWKLSPILILIILLLFSSLACMSSGKADTQEVDTAPEQSTEKTNIEEDTPSQAEENTETEAESQANIEDTGEENTENTPSLPDIELTPGTTLYTNANVVRDVVIHEGTAYTATLGGMVSWDLETGEGTRYTTLDGLKHISAHSITVCDIPETRVIVGTQTGLSMFDPATKTWDNTPITPEDSRVDSNEITRVYCDSANQRLLIGYYGFGVLDLNSGEWKQYTSDEGGITWNAITDITVVGEDIYIASGYNGISKISSDSVTIYNEAEGMPSERAQALAGAPDGTLWVGTSKGLAKLSGGSWTLYDRDTVENMPADISELEIASDGTIWIASAPFGSGDLCLFDPQTESCVETSTATDWQPILGLALDSQDQPIYITSEGTYRLEGQDTQSFILASEQLATNFVDSFYTDSTGALWVGTDGGIHKIDPANPESQWETFIEGEDGEGPGGNWASNILEASDGSMWFTIINGSLSQYKQGEWFVFEDYYSYDALAEDDQGHIWVADDSKGIAVLDSNGTQTFTLTMESGLPADGVRSLLFYDGAMWIGTVDGLAKYANDQIEIVLEKDNPDMPSDNIAGIVVAPDGSLLLGTSYGVVRFSDGAIETIMELNSGSISSIAIDSQGGVYLGTSDGLLYSTDLQNWTHETPETGFPTRYVNAVHIDAYDTLWAGCGSSFNGGGLIRIIQ